MKNSELLAKQSFEHLLKNNSEVRVKDLEAEVINLISYLSLRQTGDILWKLSFLDETLINSVINNQEDVLTGITDATMKLFPDSYNNGNAYVGMQGVIMNLKLMSAADYSKFLKDYFIKNHRIQIQ
jgi:hypothetical protein